MRSAIGIYAALPLVLSASELADNTINSRTYDVANSSSTSTLPWHQRIFSFSFESTDEEDLEIDITTKGKNSDLNDIVSASEHDQTTIGSVDTSLSALDPPSYASSITSDLPESLYTAQLEKITTWNHTTGTTLFSSAVQTQEIPLTAAVSYGQYEYKKGFEAGIEAEFYGTSGFYDGFNQGESDGYNTGYQNGFRAAQTGSQLQNFREAYIEGENHGYYDGYVDAENSIPFHSSLTYVPTMTMSITKISGNSTKSTALPSARFSIQTGLNSPFTFPTMTADTSYSYPPLISVGLEEPPTSAITSKSENMPTAVPSIYSEASRNEPTSIPLIRAIPNSLTPTNSYCDSGSSVLKQPQNMNPTPLANISPYNNAGLPPLNSHQYGSIPVNGHPNFLGNPFSKRGLKETYLEGFKDGNDDNSLNIRLKFNPGTSYSSIDSKLSKLDSFDPFDPSDSSDGSSSSACSSPTNTPVSGQCGCNGQCTGQCGCSYSSSGGLTPNAAAISPQGYSYQPYFVPVSGYYPQIGYPPTPQSSQYNGDSSSEGPSSGDFLSSLLNYVRPSYWLSRCSGSNCDSSEPPSYQRQPFIPPPPQPYYYQAPPPVIAPPPPPPPPPQMQVQYVVPAQQRFKVQPAPRYYINKPQQYVNPIRAVSNGCDASVYYVPNPPQMPTSSLAANPTSDIFQTSYEPLSYTYAGDTFSADNSRPTPTHLFTIPEQGTRPAYYTSATQLLHSHTAPTLAGYATIQPVSSGTPFGAHISSVSPAQISDIDSGSPDLLIVSSRPTITSSHITPPTTTPSELSSAMNKENQNTISIEQNSINIPSKSNSVQKATSVSFRENFVEDPEEFEVSQLPGGQSEPPVPGTPPHPGPQEPPKGPYPPPPFPQGPFGSQGEPVPGSLPQFPQFPQQPPQYQPYQRPPPPPPMWYSPAGVLPPQPGPPRYVPGPPELFNPPQLFYPPQIEPNNMDPRTMETNMMIKQGSQPIYNELPRIDIQESRKDKRPAHVKPQLNLNYQNSPILNIFSP